MRKLVGIDIGNYAVKVIVAGQDKRTKKISIIGAGAYHSRGILKGAIIDKNQTSKSIEKAVEQAEKNSGTDIENAFISVGGIHLTSIIKSNEVLVSTQRQITKVDVEKIRDSVSESIQSEYPNHTVIYQVPISYTVDTMEIITDPVGLIVKNQLKIKYFTVVCFNQHLKRIEESVENVGISVDGFLPGPIASSFVTLTQEQKETGCVLVDIGAQTVSILVYDEGVPISLKVFPIGSMSITNSLASNLKISISDAERIKIGVDEHPKMKEAQRTIEERLKEIFKLVAGHLKEIDRFDLLPGGIVISGGSVGITSIKEIATSILKLPTKIINIKDSDRSRKVKIPVHNSAWSAAYGLTIYVSETKEVKEGYGEKFIRIVLGSIKRLLVSIKQNLS